MGRTGFSAKKIAKVKIKINKHSGKSGFFVFDIDNAFVIT